MASPFSLPEELVEQAQRERSDRWLGEVAGDLDRQVQQAFGGLKEIARATVEPLAPIVQALQGGGLRVPTLEDLTPEWMRPSQAPETTGAASEPGARLAQGVWVPNLAELSPGGTPVRSPAEIGRGARMPGSGAGPALAAPAASSAPVAPDEPVTHETVTRSAAAALERAGLPPAMAPYLAGIAINEGILQPGTIARDYWSVGGVKAPGSGGVVTVPTREYVNGQWVTEQASFGRFNSMQEGMDALAAFVRDSPRFGPIVQEAARSGDYAGMIERFRQAGYATDPDWTRKVTSIASGLPVPATPRPGAAPAEEQPAAQAQTAVAVAGQFTRNQGEVGRALGLPWERALEICGPVAAAAFLRATGRLPGQEEAEAMRVAQEKGYWQPGRGMGGPGTQSQLLTDLGVANRLEHGVDWRKVAADVQRGNPVIVDTPGHYYVVEGYDPQTGQFDLGESARFLRASGGRRWFRPEEIPALGMGAPRSAIYLDNPETPRPSVVAGRVEPSSPVAAQAAGSPSPVLLRQGLGTPVPMPGSVDQQATGGVPGLGEGDRPGLGAGYQFPYGGVRQPLDVRYEGEEPYSVTDREGVDLTDTPLYAPPGPAPALRSGDSRRASLDPSAEAQADVYGPAPGAVPLGMMSPNPADLSELRRPSVTITQGGPPTGPSVPLYSAEIPGPDLSPQGTPIAAPGMAPSWTYDAPPSQGLPNGGLIPPGSPYGPGQQEAMEPRADRNTAPSSSPLKPVWDAAGNLIGYVQDFVATASEPVVPRTAEERARDASVAGVPEGQTTLTAPPRPYVQSAPPVQSTPGEPDYLPPRPSLIGPGSLLEPLAGLPRIRERMEQIEGNAARELGTFGRPFAGLRAVDDPRWRVANPETAAEYDDLRRQFDLNVIGQAGDAGASRLSRTDDIVQRLARAWGVPAREAAERARAMAPDAIAEAAGVDPRRAAQALDQLQMGASTPQPAPRPSMAAPARAADDGVQLLGSGVVPEGEPPGSRPPTNAERVAAADARMAEQGSSTTFGTFGMVPEPQRGRPTVEVLEEQLAAAGRALQRAREAGDEPGAALAREQVAQIESALVDAWNARRALEPRIRSEVGRRIDEPLPIRAQPIELVDDRVQAMVARERVAPEQAAELGGPASVPVRPISVNASLATTPEASRAPGLLPAVNRALSEAIVGGTGGAVIEQGRNPDEDPRTAAARGFLVGAAGFPLATRLARGAARRAGAAPDVGGGARISLGDVPPSQIRQPGLPGFEPPRPGPVPEDFFPRTGGPEGVLKPPPTYAPATLRLFQERIRDIAKAEAAAIEYQKLLDDGASPEALATFLRNAEDSRWWDRFDTLRYASMLSDPVTHGQNAFGSVVLGAQDVIERPLTALLDAGRARVTGGPREVFMSEAAALPLGMARAAPGALRDALFILQHGLRPEDLARLDRRTRGFGTNIPVIAPRGSRVAALVDMGMEAPLRALAAADAFFRGSFRAGHLAAEATRALQKQNGGKPVTPEAVQQLLANPPDEVVTAAENRAALAVLQEDRQTTAAISSMRDKLHPAGQALFSTLIPYIRTPFNIVAQGLGMTPPFGVAPLVLELRKARRGAPGAVRDAERRISRLLIGTTIMAWASWENLEGKNTGAYPESEAERSTLPPGWRPLSRKVEIGGKTYYVPLAALGPLGIPAMISILATEQVKKKGTFTTETAAAIAEGVGQLAEDQTFLRSFSDLAQGLSGRGNAGQDYLERLVAQFSPHLIGGGGVGRRIAAIQGEPSRDAEGVVEAWLATLPYGDQIASAVGIDPARVRRDVLGRPRVESPDGLAALVPIRASRENDAAVIRAFRKAGEGLPRSAPKQGRDPATDEVRPLSRRQQARWQVEFGRALREEWQAAGNPTDREALRSIEGEARQRALAAAFGR